MKKLLLIVSGALLVSSSHAQGPVFQWAKTMGGKNFDAGTSIATDVPGNIYTAGYYKGTIDFSVTYYSVYLNSVGLEDVFILKRDASGNFIWAKSFGGPGSDQACSVAPDSVGNLYVTGFFNGTANFNPAGTFNLSSNGSQDIFISKLSTAGNFAWAKSIGGTGADLARAIATDLAGNCYITGFFNGTVDFDPGPGTFNLTSAGLGDIFIEKLDPQGNFVWAKRMGGTADDAGASIACDSAGNVLIAGSFKATSDFDPGPGVFNLSSASAATSDIFISKLDSSGNFAWAKGMGGVADDAANSLYRDGSGTIYTTGYFGGTSDFDRAQAYSVCLRGAVQIFSFRGWMPPVIFYGRRKWEAPEMIAAMRCASTQATVYIRPVILTALPILIRDLLLIPWHPLVLKIFLFQSLTVPEILFLREASEVRIPTWATRL